MCYSRKKKGTRNKRLAPIGFLSPYGLAHPESAKDRVGYFLLFIFPSAEEELSDFNDKLNDG